MQHSIRIGQVGGITVELHYTWILIALVLIGSFAAYFSEANPMWTPRVVWSATLAVVLLFFGSLLLHEASHVVVAACYGIPVRSVTLFGIGGVAQIGREAGRPAAAFWMGMAGPLTNGAIGYGCAGLAAWLDGAAPPLMSPSIVIATSVSSLNLMLAVFNLIPGFPLDGGRLLRAVVWQLTGDPDGATRVSARAGQGAGLALFGFGVWQFFVQGGVGGVWLAVLGWVLLDAATLAYAHSKAVVDLEDLRGMTL